MEEQGEREAQEKEETQEAFIGERALACGGKCGVLCLARVRRGMRGGGAIWKHARRDCHSISNPTPTPTPLAPPLHYTGDDASSARGGSLTGVWLFFFSIDGVAV